MTVLEYLVHTPMTLPTDKVLDTVIQHFPSQIYTEFMLRFFSVSFPRSFHQAGVNAEWIAVDLY